MIALRASPWEMKITIALACISIGIMLDKMWLTNNKEQGHRENRVQNTFAYKRIFRRMVSGE